jgi:regulator of RNase E activity RraA
MTDVSLALRACTTSAVSDALDRAGARGPVWGIRRMSGAGMVAGPAYTIAFEPVPDGERSDAADYIDDVPAGAVVVLANAGPHCTVWGDILAEVAAVKGIAGTVIDGYCRDVDGIRELGYAVWARGAFMRSGKNRVRMVAVQQPVTLGADGDRVTVHPGDFVTADGSGVVVVPSGLAADVVATVARVRDMEEQVLADVRSGVALRAARAARGYNDVTRRGAAGAS